VYNLIFIQNTLTKKKKKINFGIKFLQLLLYTINLVICFWFMWVFFIKKAWAYTFFRKPENVLHFFPGARTWLTSSFSLVHTHTHTYAHFYIPLVVFYFCSFTCIKKKKNDSNNTNVKNYVIIIRKKKKQHNTTISVSDGNDDDDDGTKQHSESARGMIILWSFVIS